MQVHHVQMAQRFDLGETLLSERMKIAAAAQLATALRMQGMNEKSAAMLDLLESLAESGEINFRDYIGRIQNLFPRILDQVDVTLRMKIVSLLVD